MSPGVDLADPAPDVSIPNLRSITNLPLPQALAINPPTHRLHHLLSPPKPQPELPSRAHLSVPYHLPPRF